MSLKKLANVSHSEQISMPRPPQSARLGCFGFKHRCFILPQAKYSRVSVRP